MFGSLEICSPKQNTRLKSGWTTFFPYYAGFSETFAGNILSAFAKEKSLLIYDPWNGSGTTTYVASSIGLRSHGFDLNPVMVVVAIARVLAPMEADSIEPLAQQIVQQVKADHFDVDDGDPLLQWFAKPGGNTIRAIQLSITRQLVGGMTLTPTRTRIDRLSPLACVFYVALFSLCRELAAPFRSSNPTWFRHPRVDDAKIQVAPELILHMFYEKMDAMAKCLSARRDLLDAEQAVCDVSVGDTTAALVPHETIDLVLTSPPYCTRIDYTAATRVELAILSPLIKQAPEDLGRCMIGSTRAPDHTINICPAWGAECVNFLERLCAHPSKASSGYYYRTHLDYFDKITRSFKQIARVIKPGGSAVFVVQDSYYKEIHNDLPLIISQIAALQGLELRRREDFVLRRSMSGINPHTRTYRSQAQAIEAVLCFRKPKT